MIVKKKSGREMAWQPLALIRARLYEENRASFPRYQADAVGYWSSSIRSLNDKPDEVMF